MFSSASIAIFVVYLLNSAAGVSNRILPSSSLHNSSNTSAHCLHYDISMVFCFFRVREGLSLPAAAFRLLVWVTSADLPDHRDSRRCYRRLSINKPRTAFLRMLHVSDRFCTSFRFSKAHFQTNFKVLCRVIALEHLNNQSFDLSLSRASSSRMRTASVFERTI